MKAKKENQKSKIKFDVDVLGTEGGYCIWIDCPCCQKSLVSTFIDEDKNMDSEINKLMPQKCKYCDTDFERN